MKWMTTLAIGISVMWWHGAEAQSRTEGQQTIDLVPFERTASDTQFLRNLDAESRQLQPFQYAPMVHSGIARFRGVEAGKKKPVWGLHRLNDLSLRFEAIRVRTPEVGGKFAITIVSDQMTESAVKLITPDRMVEECRLDQPPLDNLQLTDVQLPAKNVARIFVGENLVEPNAGYILCIFFRAPKPVTAYLGVAVCPPEPGKRLIAEQMEIYPQDLFQCIKIGNRDAAMDYLKKDPRLVESQNPQGETPLIYAAMHHDRTFTNRLLEMGAKVDNRGGRNLTPLWAAAYNNAPKVAESLLQAKAEIDAPGPDEWTPCHIAAWNGASNVLEVLVKHGADVSRRTKSAYTPLYCAIHQNRGTTGRILVERGCDLTFSNNGWGYMHWAAEHGDSHNLELLLGKKMPIDVRTPSGETPLLIAVSKSNLDKVQLLIDRGADVNTASRDGNTALHLACTGADWEMVDRLLRGGARHEAQNQKGETSLHVAAAKRNRRMAERLLFAGADPSAKDGNGATPIDYWRSANADAVKAGQPSSEFPKKPANRPPESAVERGKP